MTRPDPIAVCIGCGCDDLHGCVRVRSPSDMIEVLENLGSLVAGDPPGMTTCHWLRVDRGAGLGVCSACPGSVERWDAGDREFDDLSLLKP